MANSDKQRARVSTNTDDRRPQAWTLRLNVPARCCAPPTRPLHPQPHVSDQRPPPSPLCIAATPGAAFPNAIAARCPTSALHLHPPYPAFLVVRASAHPSMIYCLAPPPMHL
ncbi:hypothetical protein BDZ97DRAFT_1865606 [Flammula alnicola]|nr:hypothetical protein BDZ97DRAFT_1865606 [Flammula alnicola]